MTSDEKTGVADFSFAFISIRRHIWRRPNREQRERMDNRHAQGALRRSDSVAKRVLRDRTSTHFRVSAGKRQALRTTVSGTGSSQHLHSLDSERVSGFAQRFDCNQAAENRIRRGAARNFCPDREQRQDQFGQDRRHDKSEQFGFRRHSAPARHHPGKFAGNRIKLGGHPFSYWRRCGNLRDHHNAQVGQITLKQNLRMNRLAIKETNQ
jgi:hypothetical protein